MAGQAIDSRRGLKTAHRTSERPCTGVRFPAAALKTLRSKPQARRPQPLRPYTPPTAPEPKVLSQLVVEHPRTVHRGSMSASIQRDEQVFGDQVRQVFRHRRVAVVYHADVEAPDRPVSELSQIV
jgi:hypothetical protein